MYCKVCLMEVDEYAYCVVCGDSGLCEDCALDCAEYDDAEVYD